MKTPKYLLQAILFCLIILAVKPALSQVPGYRGKRFMIFVSTDIMPLNSTLLGRSGFKGDSKNPFTYSINVEMEYVFWKTASIRIGYCRERNGFQGYVVQPYGGPKNFFLYQSGFDDPTDHYGLAYNGVGAGLYLSSTKGVLSPLGFYFGPRINLGLYSVFDREGIHAEQNTAVIKSKMILQVGLDVGHNLVLKDFIILNIGMSFHYSMFYSTLQLNNYNLEGDLKDIGGLFIRKNHAVKLHLGIGFLIF